MILVLCEIAINNLMVLLKVNFNHLIPHCYYAQTHIPTELFFFVFLVAEKDLPNSSET